jgi:hypothetical protein
MLLTLVSLELFEITRRRLYPEESRHLTETAEECFHSMWDWEKPFVR